MLEFKWSYMGSRIGLQSWKDGSASLITKYYDTFCRAICAHVIQIIAKVPLPFTCSIVMSMSHLHVATHMNFHFVSVMILGLSLCPMMWFAHLCLCFPWTSGLGRGIRLLALSSSCSWRAWALAETLPSQATTLDLINIGLPPRMTRYFAPIKIAEA